MNFHTVDRTFDIKKPKCATLQNRKRG